MNPIKRLWLLGWKIALIVGFAGLGVLGIGLMIAALWYPTGIFWGVIVFLLGLFGLLMVLGTVLTVVNRPSTSRA